MHVVVVSAVRGWVVVGRWQAGTYVARRLQMSSIGCGDVAATRAAISTSLSCGSSRTGGVRLLPAIYGARAQQQNDDVLPAAVYSILFLVFVFVIFYKMYNATAKGDVCRARLGSIDLLV
jgi:hypothetical protein